MAKYLRSKTGKKERKRRKAFLIRLYGGIFLLLLLIAGFFWLMQKPFMRISDFGVRGLDTLEAAEIISVSKEIISSFIQNVKSKMHCLNMTLV